VPDIPWFVYAMLLAPFGLILVAAGYKYLQVRAASDWPSTFGKVIVSTSEVRDVKVLDDTREERKRTEKRNFANIVYEYTVSGQKLTNNRVSIGEDRGNFEVAETIARYPVGTAVMVYYNPCSIARCRRGSAVALASLQLSCWRLWSAASLAASASTNSLQTILPIRNDRRL
jgi:hypothetical protein